VGTRFQVEANRRTYTVVEDLASVFEVLVTGEVFDDVTGGPLRTTLELDAGREGLFAKALANGAFALAGETEWAFFNHATTPYSFPLTISARGYLPQIVPVSVPQALPLPLALPTVRLRPLPVRVEGRVTLSSMNRNAPPASIVRILGIGGHGRVALRTPLHADHDVNTPVQARQAAPAGTIRTLARDAERGARTLALTGPAVVGTPVLGIAPQRELEFVPVSAPGLGAGEVDLGLPLTRGYLAGTEVDEFTFSTPAAAPVRTVERAALAGDGLLLLDAAIGLATTAVQVGTSVTGPIELHSVGATTDADGFYALEGIGGVTEITLRARPTPTGAAGPGVLVALDYGRASNVVNLQLAP
jgi:hypothetical protein